MRLDYEQVSAINDVAYELGIQPEALATAIAYETIGTFDPGIKGGANKDGTGRGTYKGLIQFSPRNQAYFGVKPGMTFSQQMRGPVKEYLQHTGVKPGMGLKDIYSAILAGAPGRYGRKDINGTVLEHVARMEATYGKAVADALAQGATPSQGLLDFAKQEQQLDPFAVDTSFAGLFGMDSLPGIDGLHSSQMARDGVPQGNPNNVSPAMEMFAEFNEARDGNQATGIGAAFQDALGPSLSDFTVSDPFSAGAAASSVADKMSRDATIGGYQEYANSRSGPSVPASRFDQAFDVFGAPSVAATTATGLPALDAPVDIAARPEVMGPSFDLSGVTATPSAKPGKEKSRDPNELSTLGKAAFGVGLMTNPAMAIGGLALSNLANGRPVNAGMGFGLGSKIGGLGGLGGLFGGFDGSPSVGTSALDYATGRALGNPNYTGMDFSRDFTNMGGMISNGRAAPGMVTAAEFNAGLRDSGLAIGVMEGLSRDFGGLGGLGGSSGSGKGGKGGSGSKGGGNKDEAGMSGADGGM